MPTARKSRRPAVTAATDTWRPDAGRFVGIRPARGARAKHGQLAHRPARGSPARGSPDPCASCKNTPPPCTGCTLRRRRSPIRCAIRKKPGTASLSGPRPFLDCIRRPRNRSQRAVADLCGDRTCIDASRPARSGSIPLRRVYEARPKTGGDSNRRDSRNHRVWGTVIVLEIQQREAAVERLLAEAAGVAEAAKAPNDSEIDPDSAFDLGWYRAVVVSPVSVRVGWAPRGRRSPAPGRGSRRRGLAPRSHRHSPGRARPGGGQWSRSRLTR